MDEPGPAQPDAKNASGRIRLAISVSARASGLAVSFLQRRAGRPDGTFARLDRPLEILTSVPQPTAVNDDVSTQKNTAGVQPKQKIFENCRYFNARFATCD